MTILAFEQLLNNFDFLISPILFIRFDYENVPFLEFFL